MSKNKGKKEELKKKLTPIKKVEAKVENKAEEILKDETKSPTEAAAEIIKLSTPERPTIPASFCMEPSDWEGNGVCYDPHSNSCTTCAKDFPETLAVCKARADYLVLVGKTSKTAKVKKTGEKAVRIKKDGKPPQSIVIDGYLRENKTLAEMVTLLATSDFGGETDAGKNAARARLDSHLKAIRTGTYCRSEAMKPIISYLTPEKK